MARELTRLFLAYLSSGSGYRSCPLRRGLSQCCQKRQFTTSSRAASGTTSTFLGDALGSTIGLVSANNGPIATNYTYQPFGATTVGGSANGNSYEFTGRENDGTGLYFYRARYYSPTFQRFIAQDPLGFGGRQADLYVYVANTPLQFTDPFGTCGGPCGTVGGAAFAVGITVLDITAGAFGGFESGGLIGTGVGILFASPEVGAPIGAGLGTLAGMWAGAYNAAADVGQFCNEETGLPDFGPGGIPTDINSQ